LASERQFAQAPLQAGQFRTSTQFSLDDDQVATFVPYWETGFVLLNTDATTNNAMAWYRVSSANMQSVYLGSNAEITTGVLAGTTGNDNKVTMSIHTDGKLYVENRSGANRTLSVTFLA
jgi:hypothetical protein